MKIIYLTPIFFTVISARSVAYKVMLSKVLNRKIDQMNQRINSERLKEEQTYHFELPNIDILGEDEEHSLPNMPVNKQPVQPLNHPASQAEPVSSGEPGPGDEDMIHVYYGEFTSEYPKWADAIRPGGYKDLNNPRQFAMPPSKKLQDRKTYLKDWHPKSQTNNRFPDPAPIRVGQDPNRNPVDIKTLLHRQLFYPFASVGQKPEKIEPEDITSFANGISPGLQASFKNNAGNGFFLPSPSFDLMMSQKSQENAKFENSEDTTAYRPYNRGK